MITDGEDSLENKVLEADKQISGTSKKITLT